MKLTPEKLTAFCAALAETCNVSRAAAAVGISRWTAYQWRKTDTKFAEAWDDALKAALLGLEDEAHRRAFQGAEEPLTHQGQFTYLYERDERGDVIVDELIDDTGPEPVVVRRPRYKLDNQGQPALATVRKYSDTLAIFLLKAHNPDRYRDKSSVELTGKDGGPIEMDPTARAARLAALTARLEARATGNATDDVEDLA